MYVNPHGMKCLDPSFQIGPYDVLCARGKAAYDAEGNRRFRQLVQQHQQAYSECSNKQEKSKIVSHIVNTVRQASPNGGFVKKINGTYYEVGDRHAKEKIGQTFRDLLHTKYASSTKAKARARVQVRCQSPQPSKKIKTDKPPVYSVASSSRAALPPGRRYIEDSGDLRSSFSVVSDASEDGIDQRPRQVRSNEVSMLPPLKDVHVRVPRTRRSTTSTSYNPFIMDILRSSIETFDGKQQQAVMDENNQNFGIHQPQLVSVGFRSPGAIMADLEPLSLTKDDSAVDKVDFHDSNSTIETEAMSEYSQFDWSLPRDI